MAAYDVVPQIPDSGWVYNKNGWLEGIDQQQWSELESAVQGGFSDISAGGSAGSFDAAILSRLEGSGMFTNDELDAIDYGLDRADPHGTGFYEQGQSEEPFVTQWLHQAQLALTKYQSAAKFKGGSPHKQHPIGSSSGGNGGAGGGSGGGGGSEWRQLLSFANRIAGEANTQSQSGGTQYEAPQIAGAAGGSSVLLIGGLAAAGVVAWLIFRKKKGAHSEHERR